MHDDDIDGDGPGGMQTKLEELQLDQQRNGRHVLQRRSQVLAAVAENEKEIPEPSWQMLNASSAVPPSRAVKRKLGEGVGASGEGEQNLSAIMEGCRNNDDWNVVDGPATNGNANGRSKKPNSTGTTSGRTGRGARATRGKARGGVGRSRLHDAVPGMVVEEEHENEGEVAPPKTRRSSRHSPAKVPRRV